MNYFSQKNFILIAFVIIIFSIFTLTYAKMSDYKNSYEKETIKNEQLLLENSTQQQTIAILREQIRELEFIINKMKETECESCKRLIEQEEQRVAERKLWFREINLDERFQQYLWEKTKKSDINYYILLSLAYHESRFDINAINVNENGTFDYGLFQINSNNLDWVDELAGRELDVIYDTYDNIDAAILIFNFYYDYWLEQGIEDKKMLLQYTLNSYNMGISGYEETGLISREYDQKIFDTAKILEGGEG